MKIQDLTEDMLSGMTQQELLNEAKACGDSIEMAQWFWLAFDGDICAALPTFFEWKSVSDDESSLLFFIIADYLSGWRKEKTALITSAKG